MSCGKVGMGCPLQPWRKPEPARTPGLPMRGLVPLCLQNSAGMLGWRVGGLEPFPREDALGANTFKALGGHIARLLSKWVGQLAPQCLPLPVRPNSLTFAKARGQACPSLMALEGELVSCVRPVGRSFVECLFILCSLLMGFLIFSPHFLLSVRAFYRLKIQAFDKCCEHFFLISFRFLFLLTEV